MKRMIKTGIVAVSMALVLTGVFGCGQDGEKEPSRNEAEKKAGEETPEIETTGAKEAETENPKEEEPETETGDTEETPETEDLTAYPSTPLPEYHYYGPEDWAEYGDAASAFLLENSFGDTGADLGVCTPVVLKVDDGDASDVKVWGEFWVDQYDLYNTTLYSTAGGSFGGMFHFDTTGGSPLVTDFEPVEDGADYDASVDRIFGTAGLVEDYKAATDRINEYRVQALAGYINHNGLFITQMQDFGFPAVSIPNAPETPEEAQIAEYVSDYGYTLRYDMRQVCAFDDGERDQFYAYDKDLADYDVIVRMTPRSDADIDAIVEEYNANPAEFQDFREYERADRVTFAGRDDCVCLATPAPYRKGARVLVIYLIPRADDILVVEAGADYADDEEKQMEIDAVIEGILGTIELN